jgi:hypothetical protein
LPVSWYAKIWYMPTVACSCKLTVMFHERTMPEKGRKGYIDDFCFGLLVSSLTAELWVMRSNPARVKGIFTERFLIIGTRAICQTLCTDARGNLQYLLLG